MRVSTFSSTPLSDDLWWLDSRGTMFGETLVRKSTWNSKKEEGMFLLIPSGNYLANLDYQTDFHVYNQWSAPFTKWTLCSLRTQICLKIKQYPTIHCQVRPNVIQWKQHDEINHCKDWSSETVMPVVMNNPACVYIITHAAVRVAWLPTLQHTLNPSRLQGCCSVTDPRPLTSLQPFPHSRWQIITLWGCNVEYIQ